MSTVRKSRRLKSKTKITNEADHEDKNDTIPFQRLESPMPCPQIHNSTLPTTAPTTNHQFISLNAMSDSHDDNDDDGDSELFASLQYDTDHNDHDEQLRPPSQNSIASVIKNSFHHSFHQTRQMMHLCGVGVGANQDQSGIKQIPNDFQYPLASESGSVPNSLPGTMQTTSSNPTFKDHNESLQNLKPQRFPLSIYSSCNINSNESKPDNHQKLNFINDKSIPLRHCQSVPTKPEPIIPHLFMRRSASTPTSFKIGNGRSAFGKPGSISNNTSLGTPQVPNLGKSTSTNFRKVSSFNAAMTLSTPEKEEWLSGQASTITKVPPPNHDDSTTTSHPLLSQIMDSKTQKKIKERRKERRKLKDLNDTTSSASSTLENKLDFLLTSTDQSEKVFDGGNDKNSLKNDEKEKVDVLYESLEPNLKNQTNVFVVEDMNNRIGDESPVDFPSIFSEKIHRKTLRNVESPTPISQPAYQKIVDDEQPSPGHLNSNPPLPLPHSRRFSRTPPSPIDGVATPPSNIPSQKRLILKGSTSPCSHDSASLSRTSRSGQSLNTSAQTHSTALSCNHSCNRSVTSSVAEADREVRDTNRRELKRREGVDLDGSMSIQSSDTTSTNAYLALTSSPAQLRDGANIHYDRFFSNNSIGPATSQSSHASSNGLSWNINQQYSSPGMNTRNRTSVNVRSPITVSSNSISNTNSSTSTGEDPPRFVSCSSKAPPLSTTTNRGDIPPRSEHHEASLGYSKLGSSKSKSKSRSSSKSSSSRSKSSSSKSRKKDLPKMYQKIGSAKVADQYMGLRTSTPSPCNSYQTSTPVTPPTSHFEYELVDVPKPIVHRQFPVDNGAPGSKLVLVSPNESVPRKNTVLRPTAHNFFQPSIHDQRGFQPTRTLEAVTPEREGNFEGINH